MTITQSEILIVTICVGVIGALVGSIRKSDVKRFDRIEEKQNNIEKNIMYIMKHLKVKCSDSD